MSAQLALDELFEPSRFPRAAYCSDGKGYPTRLRRFPLALRKPQIQINPPTLTYWLVFDIDREQGGLAWDYAGLPYPTWSAVNPDNGHAHIVYGLEVAVCTSEAARIAPLRYLSAVYTAMAERMGADKSYAGLLTHNPTHKHWRTYWGRRQPYDLGELADYLELPPYSDHFKPGAEALEAANQDVFAYGRNCTMFDQLRAWAYTAVREYRGGKITAWRESVQAKAESLNTFNVPLLDSEVSSIAKSVAKWVWKYDKDALAKFLARQSRKGSRTKRETQVKAGRASGAARRSASDEARITAIAMYLDGDYTQEKVAEYVGKSQQTISHWWREYIVNLS